MKSSDLRAAGIAVRTGVVVAIAATAVVPVIGVVVVVE